MSTPPIVPQPRTCKVCFGFMPIAITICPVCGTSNGRYVAVLESPVTGLAQFAQCFNSDVCRIMELNGVWVLESSRFSACSDSLEVFPIADEILSVVRRIMSLYRGLSYPPTVNYIQCLDTNGHRCGSRIRGSMTVMITSPTAMTELTKPINGHPLATAILECAQKDAKISEALTLYQDIEPRWADVYDIIEFLGGPKQIEQSGFGTAKEARVVKQTANYYRHLGRPMSALLPPNPPALGKASLFAKKALSLWIESHL